MQKFKIKTVVISITFDAKGKLMAILGKDRIIRIFNFLSGRIFKKIDESIDVYSSMQQVLSLSIIKKILKFSLICLLI
jgi:hypothetical protein